MYDFFYSATDCLNGTLLESELVPQPKINFTQFWRIVANSTYSLDPEQNFLPWQRELTIYNSSRLYINLEACVNTLQGECREFLATHGSDGDNNTAQARFPCFYDKVSLFRLCEILLFKIEFEKQRYIKVVV